MTRSRSVVRSAIGRGVATVLLAFAPVHGSRAQGNPTAPIRPRTMYEDLQMLSGVLNQIRVNHPDSQDTHGLVMAAIQGIVHQADPHSFLIPSIRLSPEKEQAARDGKLYFVPISFAFFGGSPVVVSVSPGSAASRLDILPGDELVAIDHQGVTAESSEELEMTLAGARKSTITLGFERRRIDGSLIQFDHAVNRERTDEHGAVPAVFMLDAKTGYVRITSFVGEKVADDLHDALGRLEKQGMERLVLDLRDNGGGSVAEAARVAGEFLPKGAIVYTASGRKSDVSDTGRVQRSFWRSERRYPLVVMVNSGTASASELVAGALQDHDRAVIVGRPSFGKSLLMQGFPLPDGSVFVMVIGQIKTPCGRVVQRQYHTITRHDYYRAANATRDTVGRPTCKTDGGRTAYGGGGIFPDVVLPDDNLVPVWRSRVAEGAITLKWSPGYLSANPTAFVSVDQLAAQPALPAGAVSSFRTFAAEQGVPIPTGDDTDKLIERMLLRHIAFAKWGEQGLYRISAVLDRDVTAAVASFGQAQAILAASAPK